MRIPLPEGHPVEDHELDPSSNPFRSAFPGRCTIDPEHRFKADSVVSRVVVRGNPMRPLFGVACYRCVEAMRGR